MAGLMDFMGGMFGGGDVYGDLLNDEQKKAMQQQTMMTMAAKLLQAGGPSTTPTNLGQALGGAFLTGQEAYGKASQNALQGMLTKQKIEEYRKQQDYLKALRAGAAPQPSAEGVMPQVQTPDASSIQLGATPQSSAPMVKMAKSAPAPAPLSKNDRMYADLMRKYEVATQYGMDDAAQKYFDQALKIKPIPKLTGQPFEVTDVNGNQVMVQQFDNGEIKTMSGFGPKRNVTLQNMGGRMVAVDMNAVQPNQAFNMSMSPDAVASNALAKERLAFDQFNSNRTYERGNFDLVNTPSGSFYVPKPGVSAAPPMAAGAAGNQMAAGAPAVQPNSMNDEVQRSLNRAPAPSALGQGNDFLKPVAATAIPVLDPSGKQISTQNAPEAYSKAMKQLADMRQSLGSYKDEVGKGNTVFPGSIPLPFVDSGIPLPQGEDSAAMTAKYTAMTMGLKNLYELGALAGPDMALLERQMTNPASFKGWMTTQGGLEQQIKVVSDMLDRAEENLASAYNRPLQRSVFTPPGQKSLGDIFGSKGRNG